MMAWTGLSVANQLRLLYLLVICCTAAWLPVFADDLKSRGFSGMEIAMIINITPVTMFAIQPIYGFMADRIGFRKCMLVSTLLAAVSFLAYLKWDSFTAMVLITICMSVFYNGIQPTLDSLTLELTETSASFNYGSIRAAGAVGWAATGIVTGYFIDQVDTRVIYFFSAGSLAVAFLVSLWLPHSISGAPETNASIFKSIRYLSDKKLLFFLLIVVAVSASVTTIWNFYSIYMKENGASASLVGVGLSLQGLFEIPFFFYSVSILKRLGIKWTLLVCIGASALRMLLYSIVDVPEWAIGIDVLHGLSWSLFWVVCVEYTNLLVKAELRATGQSLLYAAYFGIGAVLGNFWTGYLYEAHLRVSSIFFINAIVVALVCVFAAIFIKEPSPDLEPA
ncbi:MFS transporter [Dyadobacter pollutisoli]|uniref:MFS transporter n=1 Tax=Dyadobacter pollutisoli TaxID=2910158 RepID=A0A9E8NE05_9BACT|nr:MFS transporter [Dyadobacter pollutisoli]WAC15019.1 MFS transporter [Dyadobacter pollutisoli]